MRIRDKATDILMIIGLSISFLVVVYGIGIYNTALSKKTASEKAKFANEYNFEFSSSLDEENAEINASTVANQFLSMIDVDDGNIITQYGGIAGQSLLPFDGWIYLELNEEPKKKLDWGRYPTKKELEQNVPVIVVNNAMLNYAAKDGERYYLEVYGDKYEIIGALDDAYQTYALGEIIMFYDCLGPESKEIFFMDLCNGWLHSSYKYESDKNITEQYNTIQSRAQKRGITLSSLSNEEYKDENEEDWFTNLITELKKLFSVLIFALSAANCASISFLWIRHRMNEYSVRKAFGYSNIRLYGHVFKEFCPLVLASCVLTAVVRLISIWIFDIQRISSDNLILLPIIMLLSVIISMCIPLKIVSKVKPATGIKEL